MMTPIRSGLALAASITATLLATPAAQATTWAVQAERYF
jgi:hypothetical protein